MVFDLENLGCLNDLGGTTQERLRGLWLELKLACKKQGRQQPSNRGFSKNILRRKPGEYPEMASYWKAAHVKAVCYFVAQRTIELHVPGDDHSNVRTTCAWAWLQMNRLVDSSGRWFTDTQRLEFHDAGMLYLQTWQKLAEEASSNDEKLFRIRPKHHYLHHQIQAA